MADFVDPFDTKAPAPVAQPEAPATAPSSGGFVDPFDLSGGSAPASGEEDMTRGQHALAALTTPFTKTWEAAKEGASAANRAFNPWSEGSKEDQDEYYKHLAENPLSLKPEWERAKQTGRGLAGVARMITSPMEGAAAGLGHALETVSPVPQLTPEQKRKAREMGYKVPTAEEEGGLILGALRPGGFPSKVAGRTEWQHPTPPIIGPAPTPPQPNGPLGTTLSEGQETGALPAIQREQAALQGASGDLPKSRALEFQNQQNADVEAAKQQVLEPMAPPAPQGQNAVTPATPHEAAEIVADRLIADRQARENGLQGTTQQLQQEHNALREGLGPNNQVLAENPTEAGNIISRAVDAANENARAASTAAYAEHAAQPGTYHPASFNNVARDIRTRVAVPEDPAQMTLINPQITPVTDSALNELQEILGGIAQRRDPDTQRVLPRTPVTPRLVENARQRLNTYLGSAIESARSGKGSWRDVNAMESVIDEFDRIVAQKLRTTFTGGDPEAVANSITRARRLYADWRRTYTPRGAGDKAGSAIQNIIGRHEGQALTPEQVASTMYGANGRIVGDRLAQIFGQNSAEIGAARQGLLSHITEAPPGRVPYTLEQVANRVEQFTRGPGRSMTEAYLRPMDIQLLRNYGERLRAHGEVLGAAPDAVEQTFARVAGTADRAPASIQDVVSHLFSSALRNTRDSVDMVRRLRDRLGAGSREFGAYRQGLLRHAMEKGIQGRELNNQKIVDNLRELARSQVGREVYTAPQRQLIEQLADLHARLIVPQMGRNWSNTSAFSRPAVVQGMQWVVGAITDLIAHSVGVPFGVSEALGYGAAKASKAIAERAALRPIARQMPLVGEQLARYQRALSAYNRTQSPFTKKTLAAAGASLSSAVGKMGIDLSKIPLQMPSFAPAQEKDQKRAAGGGVQDEDTAPPPDQPGVSLMPDFPAPPQETAPPNDNFSWVDQGNQSPNEIAAQRLRRAAGPHVPRDVEHYQFGRKRPQDMPGAPQRDPGFTGEVPGYGDVDSSYLSQSQAKDFPSPYTEELSPHDRAAMRTKASVKPMAGRKEGSATSGLDVAGTALYNIGARPYRIWNALNNPSDTASVEDAPDEAGIRPSTKEAVAATSLDVMGLPGLVAPRVGREVLTAGMRRGPETSGEARNALTSPQLKEGLQQYVGNDPYANSFLVNTVLRHGEESVTPELAEKAKQLLPKLDEAFTREAVPLEKDTVLWRAAPPEAYGQHGADPGFVHTTESRGIAQDIAEMNEFPGEPWKVHKVLVPKGTPVIKTDRFLDPRASSEEQGVLLPRGGTITPRGGQLEYQPPTTLYSGAKDERAGVATAVAEGRQAFKPAELAPNNLPVPYKKETLSSDVQNFLQLSQGYESRYGKDWINKLSPAELTELKSSPGVAGSLQNIAGALSQGVFDKVMNAPTTRRELFSTGAGLAGTIANASRLAKAFEALETKVPDLTPQLYEKLGSLGPHYRERSDKLMRDYWRAEHAVKEQGQKAASEMLDKHYALEEAHYNAQGSSGRQVMEQLGIPYEAQHSYWSQLSQGQRDAHHRKYMQHYKREAAQLEAEQKQLGHSFETEADRLRKPYEDQAAKLNSKMRQDAYALEAEAHQELTTTQGKLNLPKLSPEQQKVLDYVVGPGGGGFDKFPNARVTQNPYELRKAKEFAEEIAKDPAKAKLYEQFHKGDIHYILNKMSPEQKAQIAEHIKPALLQDENLSLKDARTIAGAFPSLKGFALFAGKNKAAGAGALYSNVEKAIGNAPQAKMTADQWAGWLRNQPGVKKEELDWIGLPSGNHPVTKEQMLSHVKEHNVQLNEVEKGGAQIDEETIGKLAEEMLQKDYPTLPRSEKYDNLYDDYLLKAEDELRGGIGGGGTATKYNEHQLPGGENYREMLLTIPFKRAEPGKVIADQMPEWQRQHARPEAYAEKPEEVYRSNHWDEPNVLIHMRMNDRQIPGVGESLHLDELQSDWHQAGRKRGYSTPGYQPKTEVVPNPNEGGAPFAVTLENHFDRAFHTREEADAHAEWLRNTVKQDGFVPNAPYKNSWPELGLRRAIVKAARENKDAISWTPGAKQAERYDLSKQVDKVQAVKNHDGTYQLSAMYKGSSSGIGLGTSIPSDKLADYVGKDLAKKIVKDAENPKRVEVRSGKQTFAKGSPTFGEEGYLVGENNWYPTKKEAEAAAGSQGLHRKEYSGLDLKVGGEGMKAFYDKMLVDKANAIGKKYGAKVEWKDVRLSERDDIPAVRYDEEGIPQRIPQTIKVPVLRLTPELKEHALKHGMPLFANQGGKEGAAAAVASDLRRQSRPLTEKEEDLFSTWGDIPEEGFNGKAYDRVRTSKTFGTALETLPKYNGDVYRGTLVPPESIKSIRKGQVIEVDRHSAASPKKNEGARFADSDDSFLPWSDRKEHIPVLLKIQGGSFPNFSKSEHSSFAGTEVVVPMGTKLKVLGIKPRQGGYGGYTVTVEPTTAPATAKNRTLFSNQGGKEGTTAAMASDLQQKPVYHWTHKSNVASIQKEGLRAVSDEYAKPHAQGPGVNFVKSPKTDLGVVLEADDRLLEIDPKGLDPSKFVDHGGGWTRYLGAIPAKNIKRIVPTKASGGAVTSEHEQYVPGEPAQENYGYQSHTQQRAAGGRVVASNIDRSPTEAQKAAGNYAKDKVYIHGLQITLEHARGHYRSGVGPGGTPWRVKMPCAYGYVNGTIGADKDHVDVFLGPRIRSPHVFVVDQLDPTTKKFDEHKVLLGFGALREALRCYTRAYSDGKGIDRIGGVVALTISQLKSWLHGGNTRKPLVNHH